MQKERKKRNKKEPLFSNRDLLLNIDNPYFEGMVNLIYPPELQLNKTNTSDTEASFLDLHLSISNGFVSSKIYASRKLLRIKVTPDLHLTYSKNGGNLRLVLKMKNIACISILLTKHFKYTYLYLSKFVLYCIVAFEAN